VLSIWHAKTCQLEDLAFSKRNDDLVVAACFMAGQVVDAAANLLALPRDKDDGSQPWMKTALQDPAHQGWSNAA
jgi:hypothetical protein